MTKKNLTVAITGASGFLGGELIKHFSAKGWKIIALVRGASKYKNSAHVTYSEYDLEKPIDAATLKDVDYVVHAAVVKFDRTHPDAMQVNIVAAKSLVAACKKAGVKKALFMSSMSSHEGAESVYGRQKLAIEKVFSGPRFVSFRSGLIMGNGGIVKQMVDFMRSKHVVPLVGGGKQPLQVVGVYNLARAIENALMHHHGLFTVASPEVYTYKEFYQAISKELGITVLFIPVPFSILFGAMKIIAFLHLPLAVNSDSALGLKHLRSAKTAADLNKLDIYLDTLPVILKKINKQQSLNKKH